MNLLKAAGIGFIGATVLTIANDLFKKNMKDAPRLDVVTRDVLDHVIAGKIKLTRKQKHDIKLAGNMALNAVYFAAAANPKYRIARSLLTGGAIGASALLMSRLPGARKRYGKLDNKMKAKTVAYYSLSGLTTGLAARGLK